jgi:hypothetical protein
LPDVNLSRRGFLKLLGVGGVVAAVGMFANFAPLNLSSKQASAQTLGSWTLGADLPFPTIHAALLKNGKIMTTPGSGWQQSNKQGPFKVSVFDPITQIMTTDDTLLDDLFCCGFAQLVNGNILIAGGTTSYADGPDGKYHGGNFAYEFDVDTHTWNKISSMAHGRWYPSMGTLSNGKVYVMTGLDEYGTENDLTEIYDPVSKTFSIKYNPSSSNTYCVGSGSTLPGAGSPCYGGLNNGTNPDFSYYSRSLIMPSGLVFLGGMRKKLRLWDPSTGIWSLPPDHAHGDDHDDDMIASGRTYGTSVLLPLNNTTSERGRVLLAGGQANSGATVQNTAELVDFNAGGSNTTPFVSSAQPMTYARMYVDPVILPTGEVVIFGGTSGSNVNSVLFPEMFDPITNTWKVLSPASVGRFYHSASLLLPDGRVWVSSGTPNMNTFQATTEFYSPWYFDEGTRPIITGAPTFQPIGDQPYSGTITIPTPDGLNISSVSLLRLANVTHHFDAEHRCIWLASSSVPFVGKFADSVVVNAPINANIAPPGYYMIHVLNALGVPSEAKIIQIGAPVISGPDTTPPIIGISSPSARSSIMGPSGAVPITISGTANDSSSGVQSVKISIDSETEMSATPTIIDYSLWTFSTTISTQGPHKIKAIATDNVGNISSIEIPITVFFN